ncbi:chemotaxis protein CheW [Guyparkeria sp. 1SP6A2]|nr:chemotaxis protein CheW [Guyparkeria sp. 1SP6A2]
MAIEKQHAGERHSMVDQDAAITEYLDGLLRDPDGSQPISRQPPRARRAPGLKVINVAEALEEEALTENLPDPTETTAAESPLEEAPSPAPQAPDTLISDPEATAEQPAESAEESDAEAKVAASTDANAEEELPEARGVKTEVVDESTEVEQTEEPAGSVEIEEASPWGWLRVGKMLMALPAQDIVSRHPEPTLTPVPGAPAHIAGSLEVDGRPRLILSLAGLTGARPRADVDQEVFLLGNGGLWGVLGERVEQPAALEAEAVEWRSDDQRQARRGWLAGTAPSAGVAVLDVQGLRAALKNRN